MSITLRVHNSHISIDGTLNKEVYQGLKKALGYKDPQAVWRYNPGGHWDGVVSTVCFNRHFCKCAIKKDGTHFPTGLLSNAREFFGSNKIDIKLIDVREKIASKENWSSNPEIPPYDYQESAIDKACNQGRGIIKIATGGGKTFVGASIIAKLACKPFIFYVTSLDLLKQAKNELERFILQSGQAAKIGTVGGGKCDIQDITVMTVQTAMRALGEAYTKFDEEDDSSEEEIPAHYRDIAEVIHSAKGIISDECQHWQATVCQTVSDHSVSAFYKFGLSATPHRDLGDDLLIDACFGKPIVDINASFLIDRKFLVPPKIYFVHTPKKSLDGAYATVYKDGIVENQERNLIISHVAKKMTSSGRQVLILVRQIAHGETLESMIPGSFFMHGSHSANEREGHIKLMRERKAAVTISTSIFDEGVDVKPLDGLILAGSGKSATRALQRVGRVIRNFNEGSYIKKDAMVVDFQDNFRFMNAHSRKRRQIYLTEPRFDIKDIKP